MIHRFFGGDGLGDSQIVKSAYRLKLEVVRSEDGGCEIGWEIHGSVSPDANPEEGFFNTTQDTQLVDRLLSAFTQKREGGQL